MLKDGIQQQLAAADRSHLRQAGVSLVLRALKYLAVFLVALFALDVALHMDATSRVGIDLFYIALLLTLILAAWYVAQIRRNSPERVARMLESRDPSLGSQLINFLQLRHQLQAGRHEAVTRALTERAVGDYTRRLEGRDLKPLAKSPVLRRDLLRAAIAVAGVGTLLAVLYPVTVVELPRFLDPFGDHPPYSFTQIEIFDPADGTQVDYNGGVIIKAKTGGHRPDDLFLSFYDPAKPEAVSTVPMFDKGEAGFYQAIGNIKTDLLVYAHTKNGHSISKMRRINVVLTPKIEHAFVEIAPPAYTGLPPKETALDSKNVSALVGSRIKFRLQSNRPLAGGAIAVAGGKNVDMTPSGPNEVSGSLTADDSTRLQFNVQDTAGNVSQEKVGVPLTVTHDLPPDISIDAPAQDGYVCDDFKVEGRISASDDYGLKTVRIYRALNEVYSAPKTISFDHITRNDAEKVLFDIKSLGVQPGDMISLYAEAIDTCPDPHLARTKTLHLMVISTDDYNNFLRKRADISDVEAKYAALINEFHDLLDQQKALADEIRKTQEEMKANPAAAKDLGQKLDKLMAEQSELNQKLSDLANRMDHAVRPKPLYDVETDLQNELSQKAQAIRSSIDQNNQALKQDADKLASAPASGNTTPSQLEALASLQDQAQQQLEKLSPVQKKAEEETLQPLKDAALMNAIINDFNAVKFLYDTQTGAASEAKAYENREATSDDDKLALRQMAGTEREVQLALAKVVENLRKHASAAEATFPKAAQSARDLADAIENPNLPSIAGMAANTMLSGDGPQSYATAERLHQELAKLFEDVQAGGSACKGEMDKYLKLMHQLNAGNTFKQMQQGRKFGFGFGNGKGEQGQGEGDDGGEDGYATSTGQNFGVFGNETLGGDQNAAGNGGRNSMAGSPAGNKIELDKGGNIPGVNSVNRPSAESQSEAPIDEYRDVIDAYFNSVTK